MAVKKNYGIMQYTKSHNKPAPTASVKYLAKMFDLETVDRIVPIANRVRKELNVASHESIWDEDHELIRAIFLEKQLLLHGRKRIKDDFDLDDYSDNTLASIARDYYTKVKARNQAVNKAWDNYNKNNTSENHKEYCRASTARDKQKFNENAMRNEYRHSLKTSVKPNTQTNPQSHPALEKQKKQKTHEEIKQEVTQAKKKAAKTLRAKSEHEQCIVDWLKNSTSSAGFQYENMLARQDSGKTEIEFGQSKYKGASTEMIMGKYVTRTGEYKNIPLQNTLKKILDDILGTAEVRSVERGFNRPSRFSHFIKGCFLPVYRCNKPRKRPAFYIDASGSMEETRGGFRCVTSAIGAFLYSQHRRISELRPKYYAFRAGLPERLDLSKELPKACGGTTVNFLSCLKPQENSIVITDAEFSPGDLMTVRMWAINNPNAQVHWIVNQESTSEYLKTVLSGMNKHKIHYTKF